MKKILLLLILPILAFANIGKITVVKGDVQIQRESKVIKAMSGAILKKNDFIKTEKNGKVQIVFTDKTVFTVGKSSTLDIADYLYDEAQPKKNTAKFNVLKGAFSSITGRIGKLNKSKFKLKTKSASIGIRGTIIKANQEVVMCTEGAITVTTNNGVSVRVDAGFKTNVSSGTPTAPEAIKENEDKELGVEPEETLEVAGETSAEAEGEDKQSGNSAEAESTLEDKTSDEVVQSATDEAAKEQAEQATVQASQDEASRNLQLTGRTIDATGQQQLLSIDAKNVEGDLSLPNSGLQITDDSGSAVDSTPDDSISWGHWADDPTKKWVAGQTTDVKILEDMRNQPEQTTNAQYDGKVMGTVNSSDSIKMDSTNNVQLNLQLGGGKNSVDGNIEFETQSGQQWNSTFEGSTSGHSFESESISGHTLDNRGATAIESGSVAGDFYGTEAQSVGGTFELNTENDKATGVFKASK